MIHVLNFNSQIIDFISRDDNAVTIAKYHKTKDNDLLDIRILSQRAEHFKKRNRIIIQDKNDVYREYIIDRAEENGRYVDVECTASHLVDISTSKPIPPGKYEKMTINQKLSETLRDSGWVVGDCDYAGLKTNSWTSVRTPLEMISQLETAHEVQADYEIEIDGYEVVERRVNMKIPAPLFKGKEIEYGKDLLSMKRVIDFSEVKTALFALGPEPEQGKRVETFVYDDEAQEQFDLPYRYIWGVYEPETEDDNMSLQRLTTLAKTELNKRKSAAVSYEISVVDIEKEFPHEVIRYGDIVRIKNPDFTPTLYAESEVVGIEHDLISNKCTYEFGKVVEYQEDDLLRYFRNRLGYFNQKFNDKFSNVNTIVRESIEGELQYFERKILKGDTPPENPINDLLWLDTSNPKVSVLRRYWNGEWIKSSAENASDVGAVTQEQAMYSDLSNTFVNLTVQHSRLMHDASVALESEYLVDTDIKVEVNNKLNDTIGVFNEIKQNLDSMTSETATIGKLVDTQALFLQYREKMQALYNTIENAKIAIDERFKLLQSQYTDEKFNEALNNVASKLGLTVNEDNQLVGEVDVSKQINESVREMTNEMLRDYVTSTEYQSDKNGIIKRLDTSDSERKQLSNQIADRVTRSEYENDVEQRLVNSKAEVLIEAEQTSNRVSKEVFNENSKTLERYTSEFINNVSTGMSFNYDDNGNIQSAHIGPEGIKIDTSKFVINDGDVIVQNGRTTIKDAYIDKLFSNQATIEYLKATDIDLNRATVSGSKNGESTVLTGGKIRSTGSFVRTFPQGSVTYEAFTESWNGVYRAGLISKQFGNRKLTDIERWLALTDKGITTQREIHSLSPDKNGARFIDFFADESYSSNVFGQGMHIYSGQAITIESEYGFSILSNNHSYIRTQNSGFEVNMNGGGLVLKRTSPFTSQSFSGGSYVSMRSSDNVEQGHVGILSDNRNMSLSSSFGSVLLKGNKVFALDKNGANRVPIYADYFSGDKLIGSIEAPDTNVYAMCHSELRVVSKAGYNGGDITYKNIRFNSWNAMSHEKFKHDIEEWNYKVLDIYKNELQLHSYKVNSEAGTEYSRIHHGIILRENSNLDQFPVEWRNSDGFDGNEVLWWNAKAIQELAQENDDLKSRIKEMENKIDTILEAIK